jgi:hypothetical protein
MTPPAASWRPPTGSRSGVLAGLLTGVLAGVLTGVLAGLLTGLLVRADAVNGPPTHSEPAAVSVRLSVRVRTACWSEGI